MADCLSLNASASRITHLAREKEEKRTQERRRNLLYLIAAFLGEQGYVDSMETLFKEAQLFRDIQVCDNVDLETIILEYSDYYYAKFNKYPKLCKKIESSNPYNTVNKKEKVIKNNWKSDDDSSNGIKNKLSKKINNEVSANGLNVAMTIIPIFPLENEDRVQSDVNTIDSNGRILKPIGNLYPPGSEWREIADIISREIVLNNLNVHWDDIKGLNNCKTLLKETTIYPIKYPELFNNKLGPWKGILLYGPPGTGKTMLAKAVATECQATFFNITSSSLISKWRGDSEKYIRVLIDLAKYYAPTIIFIDEVDWTITKSSDGTSSNSEPARRFRAELLTRLDGLLSTEKVNVTLLAATNVPWNLDAALLRRLEKRIFVDLPNRDTRSEIFKSHIRKDLTKTNEFQSLLEKTKNYSCADLKLLCKEAWMNQMRPIWKSLECKQITLCDVQSDGLIDDTTYLINALKYVKSTVKYMNGQYVRWNQEFGFSE